MSTTKVTTNVLTDEAVTAAKLAATLDLSGKSVTLADSEISAAELASTLDLSSKTVTLPATSVTAAMLASTLDLSGKTLTMPTGLVPWTYGAQVATTAGTTVELLASIPDTAREIEIMLAGVSTSAANQPPLIQLGDSGGYETSGYIGESTLVLDAGANETAVTDGFSAARATNATAADLVTGILRLSRWDTAEHQWIASGQFIVEGVSLCCVCGYKTTSAAMDRIRLTTTGGAATFDAGEARVRYR